MDLHVYIYIYIYKITQIYIYIQRYSSLTKIFGKADSLFSQRPYDEENKNNFSQENLDLASLGSHVSKQKLGTTIILNIIYHFR